MILRGGLLALPGEEHGVVGDVRISQGRIVEIGEDLADDGAVMDARGLVVLPGGIDSHVHFNDPGYTSREDFYCGTCAAAAGRAPLRAPSMARPARDSRSGRSKGLGR